MPAKASGPMPGSPDGTRDMSEVLAGRDEVRVLSVLSVPILQVLKILLLRVAFRKRVVAASSANNQNNALPNRRGAILR
jgi:hypothetical protein